MDSAGDRDRAVCRPSCPLRRTCPALDPRTGEIMNAPDRPPSACSGPLPLPAVDPMSLRRFAGHFPTGVAVVTARDAEDRLHGLTLNAVTSVFLDRPLYLASTFSPSRHQIPSAPNLPDQTRIGLAIRGPAPAVRTLRVIRRSSFPCSTLSRLPSAHCRDGPLRQTARSCGK